MSLPAGLRVDAYWSRRSVSTSEMRARVDALEARALGAFSARMRDLTVAALAAAGAAHAGDAGSFIEAVRSLQGALGALGRDADASRSCSQASALARVSPRRRGAAFTPSGAGGGDVFVPLGLPDPTTSYEVASPPAGFERLDLGTIDVLGVRIDAGLGEPFA